MHYIILYNNAYSIIYFIWYNKLPLKVFEAWLFELENVSCEFGGF